MKAEKKVVRNKKSFGNTPLSTLGTMIIFMTLLLAVLNKTISGAMKSVNIKKRTPSFTEMISKDYLSSEEPVISPDGSRILYFVRTTDWGSNSFREHCYLYKTDSGVTEPLHTAVVNSNVRWFDNRYAGFLHQGKIHIFNTVRKKTRTILSLKGPVNAFEPFGKNGVISHVQLNRNMNGDLNFNYYGNIEHVEEERDRSSIFYTPDFRRPISREIFSSDSSAGLPGSTGLIIKSFVVSKAAHSIFINCLPGNSRIYWKNNRVVRVTLKGGNRAGSDTVTRVDIPPHAEVVCISPDGNSALVRSWGKNPKIFNRDRLHIIELNHTAELGRDILTELDRQPISIHWKSSGLYFSYWQGTRIGIAEIRNQKTIPVLSGESIFPRLRFALSDAGDITFIGGDRNHSFDLYLSAVQRGKRCSELRRITDMEKTTRHWDWGTSEVIQWESSDGILIEGILRKPSDYDRAKKYPLIFMAHGGPMWADLEFREDMSEMYYYPVLQFLREDVLVLKPNYRGSRGYGESFSASKTGINMGLYSLWDLEGAVSKLADEGIIDRDRVGCMGWSHGGYISAFAATNSEMFRAVSVGGGTSDFGIYASNNQISCEVSRDFLGGNPMQRNTDLYKATSPCGNITPFTSPVLIQHGQVDSVSPLQNAKELYRGLKENGVPVEFFIFNRMGHGISSPKQARALLSQNYVWFTHHLKAKELNFMRLTRP